MNSSEPLDSFFQSSKWPVVLIAGSLLLVCSFSRGWIGSVEAEEDATTQKSAAKSEDANAEELAESRRALGPLQSFVGDWKGGGQVKRGSVEGAWREESSWSWDYKGDQAAVTFTSEDGKIFQKGRITAGEKEETYQLIGVPPGDGEVETFTGKLDAEDRITFVADKLQDGRPAEVMMRLVARGRRLVMIYEKYSDVLEGNTFMAELGYSRKGSNFGKVGEVPECVLTGGDASIAVTHEGKTYYVCCTGCRDYFIEHPDKVLAEYKERLEERKKKQEQEQQQQ